MTYGHICVNIWADFTVVTAVSIHFIVKNEAEWRFIVAQCVASNYCHVVLNYRFDKEWWFNQNQSMWKELEESSISHPYPPRHLTWSCLLFIFKLFLLAHSTFFYSLCLWMLIFCWFFFSSLTSKCL